MIRIGHGYDIHRFSDDVGLMDATLTLGGVAIPYHKKIVAHSDGDLVIHALCDALLGALALGDIGEHFPDSDPQFKNKDSRFFLRHIMFLAKDKGYRVGNVDLSIIAEAPKLSPYKMLMRESLAQLLEVTISDVNVKATTHEKLDAIGNKQGIAAHAVVLLTRNDANIIK